MVPISILSLLGLSSLASALLNNNTSTASQPINNLNVSTNAVGAAVIPPLNGVQTGGGWDPNNLASEAELDKLQDKGGWMSCLLDGSDEDAGKAWPDPYSRTPPSARSRWTGAISELGTWGWDDTGFPDMNYNFESGEYVIAMALRDLGINALPSTQGGHNVGWSIEHGNPEDNEIYASTYRANGKEYHYTGAYYRFAVNHPGRAIFAISLLSPLYAAYENWEYADIEPTPDKLPELRRASDIFATFWLYNNPNPKDLKYYFSVFILNDETLEAVASILKQRGTTDVPKWPGIKFSAGEPTGEILLGTPMGSTVTFLLLQYKAQLGVKHITHVSLFRDDDPTNYQRQVQVMLLFWIEDVSATAVVETRGEERGVRVHEFRAKM